MFPKSASNSLVSFLGKFLVFVQLGSVHVRVHFAVLDNLVVPLLNGTLLMDMLVKGVVLIERRTFPIQCRPVAIISYYTPLSEPLATLQRDPDADVVTDGRLDNRKRTPLFRIM